MAKALLATLIGAVVAGLIVAIMALPFLLGEAFLYKLFFTVLFSTFILISWMIGDTILRSDWYYNHFIYKEKE